MEPASHGRVTRALVAVTATLALLIAVLAGVAIQTIQSAEDVGTQCFDGGLAPSAPAPRTSATT
jgi:hypothetical protein